MAILNDAVVKIYVQFFLHGYVFSFLMVIGLRGKFLGNMVILCIII